MNDTMKVCRLESLENGHHIRSEMIGMRQGLGTSAAFRRLQSKTQVFRLR